MIPLEQHLTPHDKRSIVALVIMFGGFFLACLNDSGTGEGIIFGVGLLGFLDTLFCEEIK